MSNPNLTVSKYKALRGDEGDAFNCDLYWDGQMVARVSYDGRGGMFSYDWTCSGGSMHRPGATGRKLLAQVDSLPEYEAFGMMLKPSLDVKVAEAVGALQEEKKLRSWCKTKTVLRLPNTNPGDYLVFKATFCPQVKAALSVKYEGAEFVNERFSR
jgi:hypothetical protein